MKAADWSIARNEENVTTVDEPVALLNHEGHKQTHRSTRQIFTKTGLIQRNILQIIRRDFDLKCPVFEPQLFSQPPLTHCQIMYRGVSCVLYTYDLHHNFVRSPTVEKFNPQLIFHNSNTGSVFQLSTRLLPSIVSFLLHLYFTR